MAAVAVAAGGAPGMSRMVHMTIPAFLRELVNRELERDERIEWIGMPKPTFFTKTSTGAFLFAIPWTAFFLYALADNLGFPVVGGVGRREVPIAIFCLPFLLAGLGLLSAPLWTYRKTLRSAYVITDRRAITFEAGFRPTIRSYPPERLIYIYRTQRKDGSGDVVIECRERVDSDGYRQIEELGFMHVRKAEEVERMLMRLAAKAVSLPAGATA